jgi:hypothetical protein
MVMVLVAAEGGVGEAAAHEVVVEVFEIGIDA